MPVAQRIERQTPDLKVAGSNPAGHAIGKGMSVSEHVPKISILMPTLNAAKYLCSTLESVFHQTFDDWELVVMDGGSSDGTLEILERYRHPNVRVFVQKDESIFEALDRALRVSRGENIMTLCASDGYLDRDWLHTCVQVLDRDVEVSLVWGIQAHVDEEGQLGPAIRSHTTFVNPHATVNIQKKNWFFYWLETGMGFSDGTMCVRRRVYERCFPKYRSSSKENDLLLLFYLYFNRNGFLPYCIPRLVGTARYHDDSQGVLRRRILDYCRRQYQRQRQRYAAELLSGEKIHVFRDSFGNPLQVLSPENEKVRALLEHAASLSQPGGFYTASLAGLGQYYPPFP